MFLAEFRADSAPVFLCLPAMGVGRRFYEPFATELARACGGDGIAVELLSSGTARRRRADFGYREIVEEELPALVRLHREAFPGRPLYLVGHSLGGQLAVLASSRLRGQIEGIVLIAAGTAHHRSWPRGQRRRARCAVAVISAVSMLMPWYPGNWLGFGGDQPRRLMRDWRHNAGSGTYRLHGSGQSADALAAALREVALPVLSLEIAGDTVAPEGAIAELLAHLPSASITRCTIAAVASDHPWRRHFSWARAPRIVVPEIARWLQSRPVAGPSPSLRNPHAPAPDRCRHFVAAAAAVSSPKWK